MREVLEEEILSNPAGSPYLLKLTHSLSLSLSLSHTPFSPPPLSEKQMKDLKTRVYNDNLKPEHLNLPCFLTL